MKIILTIIYICLTTFGLFLMKLGGNSLYLSLNNGINFRIGFITLLGFISYILSFILWQKLIVTCELSYIVPITTGICQLLVLLIGFIFFKEQINMTSIIGAILIIIGVVLLAIGKR